MRELLAKKDATDEVLQRQNAEMAAQAAAEREKVAAERAQVAEEQALAVGNLADGLKSLAEGVLTFRLADLPEAFAALETNYNVALDDLETALANVGHVAASVQTKSQEISAASDGDQHRDRRAGLHHAAQRGDGQAGDGLVPFAC
ncbi:MAG: hypothetical protein WBF24_04110 [Xanthobacteraceae bacterium]